MIAPNDGGDDGKGRFALTAQRLAGLAGYLLGWGPDAFWAATPAEMETIMRVMLGADQGGDGIATPPCRADTARLQEIVPDG